MSKKNKRTASRSWGLIIPSEWENSKAIIHKAKSLAKFYYYIEHDKDTFTEDTDFGQTGEVKKKHIHLLFTFNSSRELSTVANYFAEFSELKENSFEKINNITGAKRYLIHADNPEKFQYCDFEIETNDPQLKNCFTKKMASVDEILLILNSFDDNKKICCKDYCMKFAPLLENMNSYQKMITIINLRKEWRLQNVDFTK